MTTATRSDVWTAAGIAIAVCTVSLGISALTLTQQFGIAQTLGEQTEIVKSIQDAGKQQSGEIASLVKSADAIRQELAWRNNDPKALMARAGLPVDQDVDYTSIADKIIALPRTIQAASRLEQQGLVKEQFTPTFGGYIADEATASTIREVIMDAASQSRQIDVLSPASTRQPLR